MCKHITNPRVFAVLLILGPEPANVLLMRDQMHGCGCACWAHSHEMAASNCCLEAEALTLRFCQFLHIATGMSLVIEVVLGSLWSWALSSHGRMFLCIAMHDTVVFGARSRDLPRLR